MTALEVSGISKSFGGVHAVREVSFAVAAGEMLAMITRPSPFRSTRWTSSR